MVERVTSGQRRVLIIELWEGEERQCGHRCTRHWGKCLFNTKSESPSELMCRPVDDSGTELAPWTEAQLEARIEEVFPPLATWLIYRDIGSLPQSDELDEHNCTVRIIAGFRLTANLVAAHDLQAGDILQLGNGPAEDDSNDSLGQLPMEAHERSAESNTIPVEPIASTAEPLVQELTGSGPQSQHAMQTTNTQQTQSSSSSQQGNTRISLTGRRIFKVFPGFGVFGGVVGQEVRAMNGQRGYVVNYEEGESETLSYEDVHQLVVSSDPTFGSSQQTEPEEIGKPESSAGESEQEGQREQAQSEL